MTLRAQDAEREPQVTIVVDGDPVPAFIGETVATALMAAGIRWLRSSPRFSMPRGLFCAMGVCQECVVHIDDRPALACTTPVREGLSVGTGRARR